ncbi:hypothetical protein [Tersicoccus sp. Bi-70]|uniref:hypothetical protein n=1 Tax=Tersicoccus sp. Bi-70 TaxID=1897634 RepID=UPI00097781A7|nr:hypothetical protein [Tersicoccus sp. Bi-70]OMH31385.1 hypothetical protein BGP79_10250 [Tersicoccus sp. Bi-70]
MTTAAPRTEPGEPAPGWLVDGAAGLDEVIERCRAHDVTVIGLAAGPGEALGIHLGSRVRDDYRRRLREAGLRLITVTAPADLLAERPDEGVAADVAEYLDLAADVGAESLTLTLTTAQAVARVAGDPAGGHAVDRLRMLADRAAALDVAAVLRNAPAVPRIGQVIDLIDVLHDQLGDAEERPADPRPAPGAGSDGVGANASPAVDASAGASGPGAGVTEAAGGGDAKGRDSSDRAATSQRAGSTRDRSADPAAGGAGRPVVIGAVWDVATSLAAGEDAATGWNRVQRLLLQSHGHVVAPDGATAAALHHAVPASVPVPVLVAGRPGDHATRAVAEGDDHATPPNA